MEKWHFSFEEANPEDRVGNESEGRSDDNEWLHICEVTEFIEEKKLQYSWRYDGYPGISYVTFELFDMGDKTRLKLTHDGIESFEDNKILTTANFEKSWNKILDSAMKRFVEK